MRHVIKAGTDSATLMLFSPEALPADFDTEWRAGEGVEPRERLDAEGRLVWITTDSDGA